MTSNIWQPSKAISIRGQLRGQGRRTWQMIPDAAKENGLIINEDGRTLQHRIGDTGSLQLSAAIVQAHGRLGLHRYPLTHGTHPSDASDGPTNGRQFLRNALQQETNRYVFRIVALKALMENPEKYGYSLRETDYHNVDCDTVSVDFHRQSGGLCQDRGINYMMLKEENPWLRSNQLTNGDHHRYIIRIPKSTAKRKMTPKNNTHR